MTKGWRGGERTFKPMKCAWCGDEFKPKTHHNRYCSTECAVKADRARSKEVITHPNGNPITEITKMAIRIGIRQGKSLSQIARELDRPTWQIKNVLGVSNV